MNNIFIKTLPSKEYILAILARSLSSLPHPSVCSCSRSRGQPQSWRKTAGAKQLMLKSYTGDLDDWALGWMTHRNLISQGDHLLPSLCTRGPFQAEDGFRVQWSSKTQSSPTAECPVPKCPCWDAEASPKGPLGPWWRLSSWVMSAEDHRHIGSGHVPWRPQNVERQSCNLPISICREWPWEWFWEGKKSGKGVQG